MTLAAKAELLRAHFGIANELNVAAVVSTASERLDLNVASMSIAAKADACINALGTTVEGAPPWEAPPTSTSQTRATEMTLMDKIEKLRTYFGLAKELPIATVISTAIERLGLSVSAGSNIVSKADACLAAIAATSEAAPEHVDLAEVMPIATPVEITSSRTARDRRAQLPLRRLRLPRQRAVAALLVSQRRSERGTRSHRCFANLRFRRAFAALSARANVPSSILGCAGTARSARGVTPTSQWASATATRRRSSSTRTTRAGASCSKS